MEFYQPLAPWYDQIFPLDPTVVDWVSDQAPAVQGLTLLDVGCGTGTLLEALSKRGVSVQGLEPDAELLALACARLSKECLQSGSMLELSQLYAPSSYNLITCLGNTLVHLSNYVELGSVLTQMRQLLTPGGSLLFQIINFDRVLDSGIQALPTLETPTLRFERVYSLPNTEGHIIFKTRLEIKQAAESPAGVKVSEQSLPLFPMRKDRIETALRDAGFGVINWYADFQGRPWRSDGFLTVCKSS